MTYLLTFSGIKDTSWSLVHSEASRKKTVNCLISHCGRGEWGGTTLSLGSHMRDAGTGVITVPAPASHLSHRQVTLPSVNRCGCQYNVNGTPRSVHRSQCKL